MKSSLAALVVLLSTGASGAEVRPGIGLGLGAQPSIPSALLISARVDVQVEGGDHYVAFYAAARFGTFAYPSGPLFVPTIEAGARWHVTRHVTLGLGVATGLAASFVPPGAPSVFLVGATIEPFTWCFGRHHELGVVVTGLIPIGAPPPTRPFDVLVLPTVGYTFRL